MIPKKKTVIQEDVRKPPSIPNLQDFENWDSIRLILKTILKAKGGKTQETAVIVVEKIVLQYQISTLMGRKEIITPLNFGDLYNSIYKQHQSKII